MPPAVRAEGGADQVNLLSYGAGALVVQAPPSYSTSGNWSANSLLDELPNTGWATPSGDVAPKVFVFELAQQSEITSLAFDTAQVENAGRGAKDVTVEISDRQDGGFTEIAKTSLAALKDGQQFALKTPASGRYLKLTVLSNWGDARYMELMDFYAYGKPLAKRPLSDNSGAFSSSYGVFRVQQTGAAVDGCYEHNNGLIESGGFDGRVLRFTWTEGDMAGARKGGPAMMIFTDDGQSFLGFWWNAGSADKTPAGDWVGKRLSKQTGACPHWKPGGNDVVQQINSQGRARLYGILFDTDSDRLKDESKPALEALLGAARSQPTWKFSIEGHTDNTATDAHNQTLSEKRSAAVKTYLVNAGVDPNRLTTRGFGASQPVSSNDTALGRSQNRRVEIVKN
jgi:outer membrane protein OmpA-like peptidoglycan-associated protein